MTTKVVLTCPDTSHWHVKVTAQDQLYDPKSQRYVPNQFGPSQLFTLKQGETRETYILATRRLLIEEVEPEVVDPPPAAEPQ